MYILISWGLIKLTHTVLGAILSFFRWGWRLAPLFIPWFINYFGQCLSGGCCGSQGYNEWGNINNIYRPHSFHYNFKVYLLLNLPTQSVSSATSRLKLAYNIQLIVLFLCPKHHQKLFVPLWSKLWPSFLYYLTQWTEKQFLRNHFDQHSSGIYCSSL